MKEVELKVGLLVNEAGKVDETQRWLEAQAKKLE